MVPGLLGNLFSIPLPLGVCRSVPAQFGIVKATALVNHYYFYGVDESFGAFFLKFCSDFPYHSGRMFFEDVIRENLEVGRPKPVQLICDRWGDQSHPRPFSNPCKYRWCHSLAH
jgi:hypothetical protein